MADKHIDEVSGVETTGHEWDGIRELNNPMPRWWVWTFYATIVWGIAYTIAYPAWPLLTDSTKGLLGWNSRKEYKVEQTAAAERQAVFVQQIKEKPLAEIQADSTLMQFAVSGGSAAFKVNCIQCHGSGAAGSVGYPNLNDDEWIWGGKVEDIYTSIAHGIRSPDDEETRISDMPAFADVLEANEIRQVAAYVVSARGDEPHAPAMIEPGKQIYQDNCAACHGEKAEGNREFGAPSLSDAIWLKASTEDQLIAQIRMPKHGVMPAWEERLGDATVKQLAIYVHSLGGGE
jgi:cytochrome c oxidase cbb3-type subunit 3